ncbi:hypothetical protein LDENG_00177360 [Lucifuga dentata]|nr:hypothetical protein LDENG_00177360 [Lucifuga dentata]
MQANFLKLSLIKPSLSNTILTKLQKLPSSILKILPVSTLPSPSQPLKLIHAFITSRLDYCNSILYGTKILTKLQNIQNSAARLLSFECFENFSSQSVFPVRLLYPYAH